MTLCDTSYSSIAYVSTFASARHCDMHAGIQTGRTGHRLSFGFLRIRLFTHGQHRRSTPNIFTVSRPSRTMVTIVLWSGQRAIRANTSIRERLLGTRSRGSISGVFMPCFAVQTFQSVLLRTSGVGVSLFLKLSTWGLMSLTR